MLSMHANPAETRTLRAEQISATVRVQNSTLRTFNVPSQTNADKTYFVNLAHGTCTCDDHQFRGVVCKHQIAAQRVEQKAHAPVTNAPRYANYDALFAALGI